jgi:CAAX protease family protein
MIYENDSRGLSFTSGFFILIALSFAGLFLAVVISAPIWTMMTGTNIKAMEDGMNNPANANAFKLIQVISVILGFLLPACFTSFLLNKKPFRLMGFKQPISIKQIGLVLLIMFTSLLVAASLGYFNKWIPIPASWRSAFDKLEETFQRQVEIMAGLKSFRDYFVGLVIMAFLPALCEESIFRGGLQNFLNRATNNAWLSIIIVSILFSLIHFSYYGFLARFFLSIVLGLIYYYTGSLWLCILGHFFNNALAITQLYFYSREGKNIREAMSEDFPYYWGIAALPVLIYLFLLLKKSSPGISNGDELKNVNRINYGQ